MALLDSHGGVRLHRGVVRRYAHQGQREAAESSAESMRRGKLCGRWQRDLRRPLLRKGASSGQYLLSGGKNTGLAQIAANGMRPFSSRRINEEAVGTPRSGRGWRAAAAAGVRA